jgi:hypothetical protein
MSDCEVLDADTAIENQRLRRGSATAIPSTNRPPSNNRNEVAKTQAVLYDEDPNSQGRQYVGSVIWRTEPVKANVGEKADIAVRAEIDIPDRKFKMAMSFRRNSDTSLPASHTAELTFVLPPDFAGGGIGNVPGILMKSNEQARGTALAGLAVKINDSFFMVGLSNVAVDRTRNLEFLNDRSWFDIPIVYRNGRRAILSFKKGASGQHAFDQAFTAWNEETGRQQMAAAPATTTNDPNSLAVEMSVTATSANPPVITGTTNLPNGTVLSVFMFGEPPACVLWCSIGGARGLGVDAIVENGRFTIGTELTGTEKLLADTYKIDVTMDPHGQSDPAVKSVIGPKGENLRGSYVVALGDEPGKTYVPIKFPRTSPPTEGERLLGLMINYTQRVFVASDAASDEAVRARGLTKYREVIRKDCIGSANGAVSAEQQAKIVACVAEGEEKMLRAMDIAGRISPSGRTIDPDICQNGVAASSPEACANAKTEAAYKKTLENLNWKRIEADNGAVYAIGMGSIQHNTNGSVYAMTCIVDNNICPPQNMRYFLFDCQGHYLDTTNQSGMLLAPPRSVVGQMAALACVGAKALSRE